MTAEADGTPLLPPVLQAYPYPWDNAFIWTSEKEDEETLAYARAVLEACLPPRPLAEPEPPAEVAVHDSSEDGYPEWTEIRTVLRERMPYARHVTAERMADAEAECARRGLTTADFEEVWTRRITAWIAEQTLYWCGLMVDDEAALTPWLMDLAERYAERGTAAATAVGALTCTRSAPESRAALARLAAHEGLPTEIRELIEDGRS
ncbi:hypothetical protein OHT61_09825 [Streptomyces sp. NBC_00178]|uniref:hypothetical protein n=1 Tax=Streptomyces sp. NBC_00178 TaxID=2975672 RepID=UPI002E28D2E9|nr:hypothetical protein [Streptomyces sp. NBC_00178]